MSPFKLICHPNVPDHVVNAVPVPAADAPADDAGQTPPAVLSLHHQRSSAVTLAAVLASGLSPSAHEYVRDPFVLSRVPVIIIVIIIIIILIIV